MESLILASASARRHELLVRLGVAFDVCPADIDESPQPGETAETLVARLALAKARTVAEAHSGCAVLGADTVVAQAGRILGKPADEDEAGRWLQALSGREHRVITALALVNGVNVSQACVVTRLWFRTLAAEEIARYVRTPEPLGAAGAYAVQGGAAAFLARLVGSYTNVVGLPLAAVAALLHRVRTEA
ncbi:MAG: Maf family protein [Gammaproteobacteria bacterium]